jgi:twitching motility protein PilI
MVWWTWQALSAGGSPAAACARTGAFRVAAGRAECLLDINCALLIDRLAGCATWRLSESSEPPAGSPGYFGSGFTDANGAYWQEINLQTLSQQPQFLSISA